MKKILFIAIICVSIQLFAQNTQGYDLIAHYPLQTNLSDISGNQTDITAYNAPFQSPGIYSNGQYFGNNTNTGSHIQTPQLIDFNPHHFIVKFYFKAEQTNKPLIVFGSSWRWLQIYIDSNSKLRAYVALNDGSGTLSGINTNWHVDLNVVNELGIVYKGNTRTLEIYLNNYMIKSTVLSADFNHQNNLNLTNEHGGYGETYKGYYSQIKVFKSNATSINQELFKTGFKLYPNPVNKFLIIQSKNLEIQKVTILDITGKRVFNQNIKEKKIKLNVHFLKKGMYFTKIFTKTKVYIIKFQKK